MFFLFGTRTDYEDKENGKQLQKLCPQCKMVTTFREQIFVENFHIFFIPLFVIKVLSESTNTYECAECGKKYQIIQGEFEGIFRKSKTKAKKNKQTPSVYDVEADFERLRSQVRSQR